MVTRAGSAPSEPAESGSTSGRSFVATYRLQLRGDLDLVGAAGPLEYLRDLGVSHVYLAPVLQATAGSTHGYDVVDTTRVDDELGGDEAFAALVDAAHAQGLGVVLDIVPNHLATDPDRNRWWRDVLRHGRSSRFAAHFDIVWDPPDRKLRNQILVPVLGDHYGRILERGELVLERQGAELCVRYHERTFPLDPISCAGLLERAGRAARSAPLELAARSLERWSDAARSDVDAGARSDPDPDPDPDRDDSGRSADRIDDIEVALSAVAAALADDAVAGAVDAEIARLNDQPDEVHRILDAQHYRLARWQTGSDEIAYRRFFDISDLVGVRVERPEVFADTHRRIGGWMSDGLVDGLRVDHPDGLADPAGYFGDLRALADDAWIVAEKIVEHGEELPSWAVDGSTGYEFAAAVNRLFVAADGYDTIAHRTSELIGQDPDRHFGDVVREAKLEVLEHELAAELRRLADALVAVCEDQPRYRDFARRELLDALAVCLACLPVYRTYVTEAGVASEQDRAMVTDMVRDAAVVRPDVDPDLLVLVGGSVLGDEPFTGPAVVTFRRRFQQLSGAVMAKGKEDTALYRCPVVLGANEVGADPGRPSGATVDFHAWSQAASERWPSAMLTTSTHDTKRSEDVRARLDVLSEAPDTYLDALVRFVSLHDDWGDVEPDPLALITCFQAMVGAHPLPVERLSAHLEKAMREARRRTSWLDPDPIYEEAVQKMVARATSDPRSQQVVTSLVGDILVDGRVNALAQRLLLLTAPGIGDIYQGNELWDLSLVDPDNRRPVDFAHRASLLAEGGWSDPTTPVPGRSALVDPTDLGSPKLAITARTLAVRRSHPEAFGPGGHYRPLDVSGEASEHVVAYERGGEVIVVVPRLARRVRASPGGWAATTVELPSGSWADALTPDRAFDRSVRLETLFVDVPVALLERKR